MCVCVCMYMCVHVYVCAWICVCMYMCVHACMHCVCDNYMFILCIWGNYWVIFIDF